jgi:2-oxoglutarate ferredoxin oxidoreductase subunit alpha
MNHEMSEKRSIKIHEHIVEVVSDSGEGAQKAATSFAEACARKGYGLWTLEIIPSEIQPPPHTVGSASGNRIRLAESFVTNGGDESQVVFAFNEQALLSRIQADTLADDVLVIIDNIWATHHDEKVRNDYREILDAIREKGGSVLEVPLEKEALKLVEDPRRGKNMWVLGFLGRLYSLGLDTMGDVVRNIFKKKSEEVIKNNLALLEAGYQYGEEHLEFVYEIEPKLPEMELVAMNGNTALALGTIAAGFKICSMYPITPATSASHALSEIFEELGGMVHQAEDEIAAIGVAVGANYAGVPTLTITSGPGMALKTEFQGAAVITETPLVIVDVQRGGPSTGLPTKIEQGDLLSSLFATPGDAPKVILAPSTIEECFEIMTLARKLADEFRMVVIVLSDANLATGRQLFQRPVARKESLPPPMDLSPVPESTNPFDWDPKTGLSRRIIPGTPGGTCVTTTLNHSPDGRAIYDTESNQRAHKMRSRKLAALQATLKPPTVYGEDEGDLLLVGWGSTRGAMEEAVDRARSEGVRVSTVNLTFLNPFQPGLKEIFSRFKKVMTVELNYSDDLNDPLITRENRRYSQLAMLLRAHVLMDIDCFGRVPGRPLMPREIHAAILDELELMNREGERGSEAHAMS